jgi:hypothetical protein
MKGIQLDAEPQTTLELQHINVKLPLLHPDSVDLASLIPVFHSWIQDQVCDELLLDVADYSHVPDGPGVVLIGHEADYAVDNTDGRLGVRYNRKATVPGTNQDRLEQALRSALGAAERLQEDLNADEPFAINRRDIEIWVNDRLVARNADETRRSMELELRKLLDRLLGGAEYTIDFETDPRRLLMARIHFAQDFSARELWRNSAQLPG